jgi:hypothetical protein
MPQFVVTRSSNYNGEPPCEGAQLTRDVGPWWNDIDGIDGAGYVIEINTLEELIAFTDKYGQIVLSPKAPHNENYRAIEIYDAYRE